MVGVCLAVAQVAALLPGGGAGEAGPDRSASRVEAFQWQPAGTPRGAAGVGWVRWTRLVDAEGRTWLETDTRRSDLGVRWHQVERLCGHEPWFLWRELAAGGSRTLRASWAEGRLEWVEWSFGTRRAEAGSEAEVEGGSVGGDRAVAPVPIGELGLLERSREMRAGEARWVFLPTSTEVERFDGRVVGALRGAWDLRWVLWSDARGDLRAWSVLVGPSLLAYGGAPGGGWARRIAQDEYEQRLAELEAGA